MCPFDTRGVVVVHRRGFGHDEIGDTELVDDEGELLELLDTFVSGIDFGFS